MDSSLRKKVLAIVAVMLFILILMGVFFLLKERRQKSILVDPEMVLSEVTPSTLFPFSVFKINIDSNKNEFLPKEKINLNLSLDYIFKGQENWNKLKEVCIQQGGDCDLPKIYRIPFIDNLGIFAQIWKKDSTESGEKGDFLVTEFFVEEGKILKEKEKLNAKFDWQIPGEVTSGDYYLLLFLNKNKNFEVFGSPLTVFSEGNRFNFKINKSEGSLAGIELDKNQIKVNGEDYFYRRPAPSLAVDSFDISIPLNNLDDAEKDATVQFDLYRWSSVDSQNIIKTETRKVHLEPKKSAPLNFNFKESEGQSVYNLKISAKTDQSISTANVRFVLKNKNQGVIRFLSWVEDDGAKIPYLCLRNANWEGDFEGKIKVGVGKNLLEKSIRLKAKENNCFVVENAGFRVADNICSSFKIEIADSQNRITDEASEDSCPQSGSAEKNFFSIFRSSSNLIYLLIILILGTMSYFAWRYRNKLKIKFWAWLLLFGLSFFAGLENCSAEEVENQIDSSFTTISGEVPAIGSHAVDMGKQTLDWRTNWSYKSYGNYAGDVKMYVVGNTIMVNAGGWYTYVAVNFDNNGNFVSVSGLLDPGPGLCLGNNTACNDSTWGNFSKIFIENEKHAFYDMQCNQKNKYNYILKYHQGEAILNHQKVNKCEKIRGDVAIEGEWFSNFTGDVRYDSAEGKKIVTVDTSSPPTDIMSCGTGEECLEKGKEHKIDDNSFGKGVQKISADFIEKAQQSISSDSEGMNCSNGECSANKSGVKNIKLTIPESSYIGQCRTLETEKTIPKNDKTIKHELYKKISYDFGNKLNNLWSVVDLPIDMQQAMATTMSDGCGGEIEINNTLAYEEMKCGADEKPVFCLEESVITGQEVDSCSGWVTYKRENRKKCFILDSKSTIKVPFMFFNFTKYIGSSGGGKESVISILKKKYPEITDITDEKVLPSEYGLFCRKDKGDGIGEYKKTESYNIKVDCGSNGKPLVCLSDPDPNWQSSLRRYGFSNKCYFLDNGEQFSLSALVASSYAGNPDPCYGEKVPSEIVDITGKKQYKLEGSVDYPTGTGLYCQKEIVKNEEIKVKIPPMLIKTNESVIPAQTSSLDVIVVNRPPTATVSADKSEIDVGQSTEVHCKVSDPDDCSDKIVEIKWKCADSQGNQENCSFLDENQVFRKGEFTKILANPANPYSDTVKIKLNKKETYAVTCEAWDNDGDNALSGSGVVSISVDPNCEEDGICNPDCDYDPDCMCVVKKTIPLYDIIQPNTPVTYQARVGKAWTPISYKWYCDKTTDASELHTSTEKIDKKTCDAYSVIGKTYEPKVDLTYTKDGTTNTEACINKGKITVEDCEEDGICNPDCPYDPDCCDDPDYFKTHSECGGVIEEGSCFVTRTDPPNDVKEIAVKTDVTFEAEVSGGATPQKYMWQCDKDKATVTNKNTSDRKVAHICSGEIFYTLENHTYEPKVKIVFEKTDGTTETKECINNTGTGFTTSGIRPANKCDCSVLIKKSGGDYEPTLDGVEVGSQITAKLDYTEENCPGADKIQWIVQGGTPTSNGGRDTYTFTVKNLADKSVKVKFDGNECSEAMMEIREKIRMGL